MRPLTPAPDQSTRIFGITLYDSLAAWAAHMEKVTKDPKRNAFLREVEEKQWFVAGGYTRALCNATYPASGA